MNIEYQNRRIYGSLYDSLKREGYFSADPEIKREIWRKIVEEVKNEN
jgi:hypothetical protein